MAILKYFNKNNIKRVNVVNCCGSTEMSNQLRKIFYLKKEFNLLK